MGKQCGRGQDVEIWTSPEPLDWPGLTECPYGKEHRGTYDIQSQHPRVREPQGFLGEGCILKR